MITRCTPKQVREGEVCYTFETFLDDLWEDVRRTLSKEFNRIVSSEGHQAGAEDKTGKEVFVFVYQLCYLAAIKHPDLKAILEKSDKKNRDIIKNTLKSNRENIELLRAILLRETSDRLDQDLTKRQAVKAAIAESKSVFMNWMK